MAASLTLLGIHGLGDHRESDWKERWVEAVRSVFPGGDGVSLNFEFFEYDSLFEEIDISATEAIAAVWKLLRSGLTSRALRPRGFFDSVQHSLRWTAGYVVAWVEDEEFRTRVRAELIAKIRDVKPDVILGHSLGSLISYDTLSSRDFVDDAPEQYRQKLTYVSLGSQIANPFVVRNLTPGRIAPLDLKQWFHLYNAEDDVFTAPIRLPGVANFLQVDTFFDIEGWTDHSAVEYLRHPATAANVWGPLAEEASGARVAFAVPMETVRGLTRKGRPPRRKALLVGINDYPDPASRLEGCVNDVFLVSAALQECGFDPETIRLCLNDRATCDGILRRMDWLLDDVQPEDELVFFYSGHGAQLPTYGEGDVVDRMDETLVPYDFDWSPASCLTDDQIYWLYSQLPYDTRLVMIFDCCHSGGIHRQGVNRVRGIDPPDDIRHRALRWDPQEQMWVPRDLKPIVEHFAADEQAERSYAGSSGNVLRLGRAMQLRAESAAEYDKLKNRTDQPGPYLPVILEACRENQYSYEYRHGVQSYGAFTYSLVRTLRDRQRISFSDLVAATADQLHRLQYDQDPQILGPGSVVSSYVPFRRSGAWIS